MADGKVVIGTSLNNKGFTTGIRNMEGELGGLKNVLAGIGKTIAAVFAIHTLLGFGKQCVELGSNVTEVQNVVDVAFGDMAYKIENFANTSIQSYGMSRLAAKKTASTYMAMARGMVIASDKASDMAISLTGLTGDVASFFNITQEEADIKLRSVFTGETETLKDLGVVMTQANLQAYAMSQAELVGLRYNFVLNQLALAHGDFARISDSWANQTRILSMQWQEFMSIIGQVLTKILAPLVKMLNNIVASLISMANTFNSVISSLFGGANNQIQQTAASASGVSDAIGSSVDNQNALTNATKKTEKEQSKLLAGFDEINKLSAGSGGSGGSDSGGSGTGAGASGGASVPALNAGGRGGVRHGRDHGPRRGPPLSCRVAGEGVQPQRKKQEIPRLCPSNRVRFRRRAMRMELPAQLQPLFRWQPTDLHAGDAAKVRRKVHRLQRKKADRV